jgi:short-subunit dehydrogenase
MNSVVIGASAGLGRAIAEELAQQGHDLFLVATDARDLEAVASDLSIRYGRKVRFAAFDICMTSGEVLRSSCLAAIGKADCLFLVSGQSDLERDFEGLSEAEAARFMQVNFEAPVRIAMAFLPDLLQSDSGACVGIGSAAQVRPRTRNTVYASSKQGLEFFFGGLRQSSIGTRCRIQYYRIGYMATQMTFGRTSPIPAADPAQIARHIVRGLRKDKIGLYLPRWWAPLMLVYRFLPGFIFRRIKA